jgi:hypothetical protein
MRRRIEDDEITVREIIATMISFEDGEILPGMELWFERETTEFSDRSGDTRRVVDSINR